MLGVTLNGTAQAIGYFVVLVVGLISVGYGWYRLVTYPRLLRRARAAGSVPLRWNLLGEPAERIPFDQVNWRPASIVEWLRHPGQLYIAGGDEARG